MRGSRLLSQHKGVRDWEVGQMKFDRIKGLPCEVCGVPTHLRDDGGSAFCAIHQIPENRPDAEDSEEPNARE